MAPSEYLREFKKKFQTVLTGYSGAGGETGSSRDTVPLTLVNFDFNADPDPAFPSLMRIRYPASKINANPCGSESESPLSRFSNLKVINFF